MEKHKITVILYPDEEGYTAFMPLFPDCTTGGETPRKALDNAKEALELLFEDPNNDDMENLNLSYVDHVAIGEIEIEVPSKPTSTTAAKPKAKVNS